MIEHVKSLVRPSITTLFAVSWIVVTSWMIFNHISVDIPYILFTVLTWGVVVWWYDDRTFFHRHQSPLDIIYRFLGSK